MLDYRGIGIGSVWVVCATMVPVLMLRGGIRFSSILILLGIACGMTVVILRYNRNGSVEGMNGEISELRSTVVEMNERIEKLTKILEE